MSLYQDILPSSSVTASNSAGIKLLQEHLRVKKSNLVHNRKTPFRPSSSHRSSNVITTELTNNSSIETSSSFSGNSLLGGEWDVTQEYDPFRPNDYEKVIADRIRKRQEEKEREAMQVKAIRSFVPYSDDEEDEEEQEQQQGKKQSVEKKKSGVAIPPPVMSAVPPPVMSAVPPPAMSAVPPPSLPSTPSSLPSTSSSSSPSSSTAAKIMAKMGYKEGQGLGREEQGISRPLEVLKTGVTQGVIVLDEKREEQEQEPTGETPSLTEMVKQPTRVVLLTNMVSPGEVDEDLEPETKEECCSKYGEVVKCVIFECPPGSVPPNEAVRIFLEFKRIESAIKAVVDLNGRFFGGRSVKAVFFDVDRFKRLDLKP